MYVEIVVVINTRYEIICAKYEQPGSKNKEEFALRAVDTFKN